jgi:hypothetical protein
MIKNFLIIKNDIFNYITSYSKPKNEVSFPKIISKAFFISSLVEYSGNKIRLKQVLASINLKSLFLFSSRIKVNLGSIVNFCILLLIPFKPLKPSIGT